MSDFGKLILSKPDGLSQEFILNKDLVTLGRATRKCSGRKMASA